ncbi:DUF2703 domain-containing protein [Sphaerimonospora sp. CA-214678]|uniref:DUF2703 domain-containing protein n=1 Tax=Sphaerimonospora sp. CA-214678 TaxID=3240029 RepID=UPI003D92C824
MTRCTGSISVPNPSVLHDAGVRLTVDYWTVAMNGQDSCGSCDATLATLTEAIEMIRPLATRLGITIDVQPRTVDRWAEAIEYGISASPTIRAAGVELRPCHPDGSEHRLWTWRGETGAELPVEAALDGLLRALVARSAQLGGFLADGGPSPYIRQHLSTSRQPTTIGGSSGCGTDCA